MQMIAEWIGYIVIATGLILIGLFFIIKILDYIPTPRRWLYKQLGKLAKKEPDVFLNMMIFFKRKYKLKHKTMN